MGKVVAGKIAGPGDTDEAGEIEWVVRLESTYDGTCVGGGEKSATEWYDSAYPGLVCKGPNTLGMLTRIDMSRPV